MEEADATKNPGRVCQYITPASKGRNGIYLALDVEFWGLNSEFCRQMTKS